MNTNYLLILLLTSVIAMPIFSVNGFYLIYLHITGKIKEKDSELRGYRNLVFICSAIAFFSTIFTCNFFVNTKEINIYSIITMSFTCVIMKFIYTLIYFIFIFNLCEIPNKIRKCSIILNSLLIFILIFIPINFLNTNMKLKEKITSYIPDYIETYAASNDYILFPKESTKYVEYLDENSNNTWLIHENLTHYFFIDESSNESVIIVSNKSNPSNSFKTNYVELSNKEKKEKIENKYADTLDKFYTGANYAPICYLINENEANIVYGLAKKDKNTNEFYVCKYIIFNITTGKLSDL